MWEELTWKVLCMYKWGGIYSQGWNWPLWLFDYPHDCLTSMTFRLYMTLCTTSGSLGLPCYITLIDNKPIMEMWATWLDMNWHDNAGIFVLLLECMSSYNAAGWWMSSWCIIASPLQCEVRRVFHGPWFPWWSFSMFFLACMLEGLIGLSLHEGTFSSHSSISHASFISLLVNLSLCMCSLHSFHSSSCHVCWCTGAYSHSWWVYHDTW